MTSSKAKSAKTKSSKGSENKKHSRESKQLLEAPDAWINELSEQNINDKNWQCFVALTEEESIDASVYLEHFNESAIKGRRLAIKAISKLEIIKTVTEHMKETNPNKDITPLSLLCSEIYKASGSKFDKKIPAELLAPLIKYILLEYKKTNKRVRVGINEMKKDQEEYRQSLWQVGIGKSKSSKATKSIKAGSSSNKSKESVKGLSKEKCFTKLRKRGEEWKDVDWVDDAPIDGPQLYITISTLFEPLLPLHLVNFNIPLDAIVRLNLIKTPSFSDILYDDELPFLLRSRLQSLAEFKRKSSPYLSFNIGKHIDDEEMKKILIKNYWIKIHDLKNNKETAQLYKDIMFLQFVPIHQDFEYEVQTFQDEIYRQVSYFLYDAFETTKHHRAYLNEIEVVSVFDTNTCNLSEMCIYNAILNSIPHEVLNIPLILDILITQVSDLNSDEKITSNSNEGTTGSLSLNSNNSCKYLINLLDSLNFNYDLFNESVILLKRGETNDSINMKDKKRILLIHGDDIRIKSFHLVDMISQYVKNRTNYMLRMAWENVLLSYFWFFTHDESFTKMCNEIIKVEEQTGHQGLHYYLYILTTNSILNSLIFRNYKSDCKFNTLDDEMIEYKDQLCEKFSEDIFSTMVYSGPNPTTHLKISSVSCFFDSLWTCKRSDEVIATNLFYIEEMTSDILLQRIQNIASSFIDVVSRTCPFTDQIVLLFHNLVNPKSLIAEQKWMGKIPTKIPIRDFVDYIILEEENWHNTQKDLGSNNSMNEAKKFSVTINEIGTGFTLTLSDLDFISNRSIKYEIMMKKQSNKSSAAKLSTPANKGSHSKVQSKRSKTSSAKNQMVTIRVSKDIKSNQVVNSTEEIETKKLKFIGYELGDAKRFQYDGWKKDLILDDDCIIILKSTKQLYGDEFRTAVISINGNNLYIHFNENKLRGNYFQTFHLTLTSGIILYFFKRPKEINFVEESTNAFKLHNIGPLSLMSVESNKSLDSKTEIDKEQNIKFPFEDNSKNNQSKNSVAYEIQKVNYSHISTLYDLKMSTPSGLYTEVVHDNNMFYIRQTQLSKGQLSNAVQQEKYRCCLPEGYIIKSMINGDFEIMSGSGDVFYIYKDKKHLVNGLSDLEVLLGHIEKSLNYNNNHESYKYLAEHNNNNDPTKKLNTQKISKRKESNDSQKINRKETLKTLENQQQMLQQSLLTNTDEEYSIYKIVQSSGKCILLINDQSNQLPSLFIRSTSDISSDCISNERGDGAKSKYFSDGSLVIDYADGSRITSMPFESDQLFSVWTLDEFEGWFTDIKDPTESIEIKMSNKTFDMKLSATDKNSLIFSGTSVISGSVQENKDLDNVLEAINIKNKHSLQNSIHSKEIIGDTMPMSSDGNCFNLIGDTVKGNKEKRKPSFADDSFVVYSLSYLIEHPNYGSVHFDAINNEVKFGLPMNTNVKLRQDGSYASTFDGANLNVFANSIDFNRIDQESTIRTITINTGSTMADGCKSSDFNLTSKLPRKNTSNLNTVSNKQKLKANLKNASVYNNFFLYSIDKFQTEVFIDYDFNYYKIPTENVYNKNVNDKVFSCFVINKDLSGFELISDKEVDCHLEKVNKENGMVIRSENKWSSLLTILPVQTNESEKWLMGYEKSISKLPYAETRSTIGKRESWIHPFVEVEHQDPKLNLSDPLILRTLHRIPTDNNILNDLELALELFRTSMKRMEEKKINSKIHIHDFNLTEILSDPSLLDKIYKEEMKNRSLAVDKFRTHMEDYFLISLMHQAYIKAKKNRIKNKEKELKTALRNKEIPPYHLSCFGQVHGILDMIVEGVAETQKNTSNSSINSIIDDILGIAVNYKCQSESENVRVESIFNDMLEKVWSLEEENIYVNKIIDKPLNFVTNEEIEFLCSRFQPGSKENPTLYIEDIILKDVLDARFQLSHYFQNLKNMLYYYRSRNFNPVMTEDK